MLLCCLAYGGMTSCSGKKSDADEQDKGFEYGYKLHH